MGKRTRSITCWCAAPGRGVNRLITTSTAAPIDTPKTPAAMAALQDVDDHQRRDDPGQQGNHHHEHLGCDDAARCRGARFEVARINVLGECVVNRQQQSVGRRQGSGASSRRDRARYPIGQCANFTGRQADDVPADDELTQLQHAVAIEVAHRKPPIQLRGKHWRSTSAISSIRAPSASKKQRTLERQLLRRARTKVSATAAASLPADGHQRSSLNIAASSRSIYTA